MSKRMFNKMYTKNDVLKIYLESLGALQILVAVQSLLLCPRDSSLCRKWGPSSGHHRQGFCGF